MSYKKIFLGIGIYYIHQHNILLVLTEDSILRYARISSCKGKELVDAIVIYEKVEYDNEELSYEICNVISIDSINIDTFKRSYTEDEIKNNNILLKSHLDYKDKFTLYYQHERIRLTEDEEILILVYLYQKLREFTIDDFIKEYSILKDKIDTFDINDFINTCTITIEESFISKIGGDDRYIASKNYSHNYHDIDLYLSTIFPNKRETIASESGYCTAYSMRILKDEEVGRQFDEEIKYRGIIRQLYDKNKHLYTLLFGLFNKCRYEVESFSNNKLLCEQKWSVNRVKKSNLYFTISKSLYFESIIHKFNSFY